jgi:urease accessory protein UreF
VRNNLSKGMRLAALHHTEMDRALATLQTVVFSTIESALGNSPNEIFRVDVAGELVAKFQRLQQRRLRLERPTTRICDLLHGPPSGRV